MDQDKGTLTFSVDSSLLFQLGEQLVAKPSVALAELVKNAYDADATQIEVTFENIGTAFAYITVQDNGHGMTFEEFHQGWMRIATVAKRDKAISRRFRRALTGAKGIGRFAARRLGNKLAICSTAENGDTLHERTEASFDWDEFVPGSDVQEIQINYERSVTDPAEKVGTRLKITGLRDRWTEDDITALRRDLISIQSPFPDLVKRQPSVADTPDPGCNIMFRFPDNDEWEDLSGSLGEAFLQQSWAYLDGSVDEFGTARYTLQIQESHTTEMALDDVDETYTHIPRVHFRIYYFVGPRRSTGVEWTTRDIRRKGKESGGVRVYLDGFRVFPYGDFGNDWLENDQYASENVDMATRVTIGSGMKFLDEKIRSQSSNPRERPFLLIPRNSQLFGAVFISHSMQPEIQITASREGLIENEAFGELKRFVQRGLYWLTLQYAAATLEDRETKRKQRGKSPSTVELLTTARHTVEQLSEKIVKTQQELQGNQSLEADSPPDGERNLTNVDALVDKLKELNVAVANTLELAANRAEEDQQEVISEISMLRLLASAGTSLLLMQHQLRALLDDISTVVSMARQLRSQIPTNVAGSYDDIVIQLDEWHRLVDSQVGQLAALVAPKNRERRQRLNVLAVVEDVLKPFKYHIQNYHVSPVLAVPPTLRTPLMFYAELYAVLLNLTTNALKAVHGFADRQIYFTGERQASTISIQIWNTGKKAPESEWERYFGPFQNDRNEHPVLGVGTGLGLAVVKDIVETYGGTAQFIHVSEPWQTGLEVRLPDRT